MVWIKAESGEYPELCSGCVFYSHMGCAACTIPAQDGGCKHYAPVAQEGLNIGEEHGAVINE